MLKKHLHQQRKPRMWNLNHGWKSGKSDLPTMSMSVMMKVNGSKQAATNTLLIVGKKNKSNAFQHMKSILPAFSQRLLKMKRAEAGK